MQQLVLDGHINPGIAIANKIEKEIPDSEIIFIGTGKKLEKDLVSKAGYKLKTIHANGFSKKINLENLKKNIETLKGFREAKKILKDFKPDVVIGTGGYICGAVISEAHKLGIPTMLHESNAYPGLAVKMLAQITDTIMVGIEDAKNNIQNAKNVVYTGTPTKVKPLNLDENQKNELLNNLELNKNLPIILVFGGSQGAKAINDTIVKLIKKQMNTNYQIIWAAGQEQYDLIIKDFEESNINVDNIQNTKILPYIYNMAEVMSISDLVVARSGAMTLTELALLGKPAIFIPLPSSSANRQEDNARVFEKRKAAKVILNNELNENNLNEEINNIIGNKELLKEMSNNSKKMAIYDVEDRIYDEIKKLVNNK